MDISTIIAISSLSWGSISKIVIFIILVALVLYFAKKYLDAEQYGLIKAKLVALEVRAEYEIQGKGLGEEKMQNTLQTAEEVLTNREKKFLKRKGIFEAASVLFTTVVAPLLGRKFK